MTLISRDRFARTELHRETVTVCDDVTCDWCGSKRTVGKQNKLFRYRTESDGGRVGNHKGLFCSTTCHTAYSE